MLGYICKYAPVEVFESMGVKMERIEPDVTNFNQAEIRMHPNICSFAKGVLEEVMNSDYEGVILTTCCDSIRRLYDVLKEEFPDKFIHLCRYFLCQFHTCCHQNGACHFIMLCLRKKIGRYIAGICRIISQHQNFTGTRN